MHESIHYSQIPTVRHNQVLQILAGVTATQPIDFSEQHLVYQQLKYAESTAPKKGQAAQANRTAQLSYYKLIRDCSAEEEPRPWRLRKEEQPEAGVKDVISRSVGERVATEANLERFKLGSEWYKLVAQFLITGCHFVQGNVVVRIVRAYTLRQPPMVDPLIVLPPASTDVTALDESGAYIVEASVHTVDEGSSELRDKAREELLAFTKSLEGAIDFYAPDRLVLDTRVKGS